MFLFSRDSIHWLVGRSVGQAVSQAVGQAVCRAAGQAFGRAVRQFIHISPYLVSNVCLFFIIQNIFKCIRSKYEIFFIRMGTRTSGIGRFFVTHFVAASFFYDGPLARDELISVKNYAILFLYAHTS